jgi:hypothetical protein
MGLDSRHLVLAARLLRGLSLFASFALPANVALSQPAPTLLEFELASTKIQTTRIQLVDGSPVPVNSTDWTTLVITPIIMAGQARPIEARCTGTLVGPVVVILAAHCLDQNAPDGSFRPAFLKVDGERVLMRCAIDPDYLTSPASLDAPRRSEDIALCHATLTQPHAVLRGMIFEALDLTPMLVSQPVLMTGYGCTDISKPQDLDTTLRLGNAVIGYPAGGTGPGGDYATISSISAAEPSLCPGDSGGPMFSGATVRNPQGQRRVRGVNSGYGEVGPVRFSKIAMLSSPGISHWALKWLKAYPGAYICGVSDPTEATSCHA